MCSLRDTNGKNQTISLSHMAPPVKQVVSVIIFWKILSNFQEFRSTFADILGDFNARSKSWWYMDITSSEGSQIDSLTATYCLWDFNSDPTHTLPNSSICIDLIIQDQPNLIVKSGVHPSLHTNISHQITYWMFDLIIEYPPLYQPLVWE